MVEKYISSVFSYLSNNPLLVLFLLLFLIPKQTRVKMLEKYLNKKLELDERKMNPEMKSALDNYSNAMTALTDQIKESMGTIAIQITNVSMAFTEELARQKSIFTEALAEIKRISGKQLMDKEHSIEMFDIIMDNHINRKCEILREKIEQNHWETRKSIIMKDIETQFRIITQEGCAIMSKWHTPYGDLGIIVDSYIDWNKFMSNIYEILDRQGKTDLDKQLKLRDAKSLMESMVTGIKDNLKTSL